ncbi:SPW repeat protein [Candidatus Parcubacteria bacterium]|nr:SPW repeat protein [Candidatus Parcubacteria bacterium]
MWQNWLNLLLGIWVIVSGYLNFTVQQMTTNLTISGILIAGLALWGALQHNMMTNDGQMRRQM